MSFQSKSALIAAAALSLAAGANAAVTFNGDANVELDTTSTSATNNAGASANSFSQGGRVEINLAGKSTSGDNFVAGRATIIANKSGGASTDDAWAQFGNSKVDLKIGRFEAADLAPQGRDTIVNRTGHGAYTANTMRGRTAAAHAAATVNFGAGSLEFGIVETKSVADLNGGANYAETTANAGKGIRPVLSFGAGPASVKLGFESGKVVEGSAFKDISGFGATVGLKAGPGNLNVNLANATVKLATETKLNTLMANYTVDMGPWVFVESASNKQGGTTEKNTLFALGYEFSLFGIKGTSLVPAVQVAKTSNYIGAAAGAASPKDTSFRVRVHYDFAAF
jgi:hypothetical protein